MIHILVQVDTRHAASREMIAGVMRFAATHGDIEVQFSGAHPSSAPVEYFRSWKPDALIADASVHTQSTQDFSALSGRAVVFVNTPPRKNCRKAFARLKTDDLLGFRQRHPPDDAFQKARRDDDERLPICRHVSAQRTNVTEDVKDLPVQATVVQSQHGSSTSVSS